MNVDKSFGKIDQISDVANKNVVNPHDSRFRKLKQMAFVLATSMLGVTGCKDVSSENGTSSKASGITKKQVDVPNMVAGAETPELKDRDNTKVLEKRKFVTCDYAEAALSEQCDPSGANRKLEDQLKKIDKLPEGEMRKNLKKHIENLGIDINDVNTQDYILLRTQVFRKNGGYNTNYVVPESREVLIDYLVANVSKHFDNLSKKDNLKYIEKRCFYKFLLNPNMPKDIHGKLLNKYMNPKGGEMFGDGSATKPGERKEVKATEYYYAKITPGVDNETAGLFEKKIWHGLGALNNLWEKDQKKHPLYDRECYCCDFDLDAGFANNLDVDGLKQVASLKALSTKQIDLLIKVVLHPLSRNGLGEVISELLKNSNEKISSYVKKNPQVQLHLKFKELQDEYMKAWDKGEKYDLEAAFKRFGVDVNDKIVQDSVLNEYNYIPGKSFLLMNMSKNFDNLLKEHNWRFVKDYAETLLKNPNLPASVKKRIGMGK